MLRVPVRLLGSPSTYKTQGFPLLVGNPEWRLIPLVQEILPKYWVQEHKCAQGQAGKGK